MNKTTHENIRASVGPGETVEVMDEEVVFRSRKKTLFSSTPSLARQYVLGRLQARAVRAFFEPGPCLNS